MNVSPGSVIEIAQKVDKKIRHLYRRPSVWLKHQTSSEKSTQRFIFHHIPKCAGTSAVDALTHWFIVHRDYAPGWSESSDLEAYQAFCDNPMDLAKFKPYDMLVGHFHVNKTYLHQRYPDWKSEGFKLVTFVREPLALQLSQYKYEIKMQRMSADKNLEHRLMLRPNWIAERFPCTEDNYIDVLDQYAFIGTMDDYQAAFNRLAKLVGKPPVDLKTYNTTQNQSFNLSEEFISEFKEVNALDYKIYEYAQKRELIAATEEIKNP